MNEIHRNMATVVRARLAEAPAVVLLGPRQVGKTTLARQIADERGEKALYLDMERPADQRRLDDPDAFLRAQSGRLVVIDEIHRVPELFASLRGIIDDRRRLGMRTEQFLLLGSASLDLIKQASETLAGRVSYLEIRPFVASETMPAGISLEQLWVRGGFPDSLLAVSDLASLNWRTDFIRSYLERDVPMFAPRMPAETIGRLWTMLANGQGSLLNQARLASSLGVSAPTVGRYIDLLADLLLVRRLRPWLGNANKRLVKSPKVYVRDSGLVHGLIELGSLNAILGHSIAGPSWEGFAIETIIAAVGERVTPFFYRSEHGAEIDLVLERGGKPIAAIEIKRSSAPVVSKGFRIACDDLGVQARYIAYSGTTRFPMVEGVMAMPIDQLAVELSG
jgi:uncharacterized protein